MYAISDKTGKNKRKILEEAELQITQVLDPYSKAYFNESYEILEIKAYIPSSD